MANHSATEKSIRQTAARTEINRSRRSRIRTYITSVRDLVAAGQKSEANAIFPKVQSEISRGVQKGIYKKNTASRIISRLNASIKKLP